MRRRLASGSVLLIAAALSLPTAAPHPPRPGPPYEVVDGMAVRAGDIALGPAEEIAALRPGRREAAILAWVVPWPGGRIPYLIDPELPAGAAESVRAAIAEWNAKTVVTLVERTSEADFVRFVPSNGCWSRTGWGAGERRIGSGREGVGCGPAAMVHEIGHAVGLQHEHQRPDRDERLMVPAAALQPPPSSIGMLSLDPYGPYDYRSTMHYGLWVFETIPPGIEIPSAGLSAGDVDGVARLYGRVPAATTVATNPPGLEVLVDGIAVTAPARFEWEPGSAHTLEVLAEPQLRGASRYLFGRWNDGAPRSRSVTAGPDRTWFEANFIAQHRVTARAQPRPAGEVAADPPAGWHTLRTRVLIEAHPRAAHGMQFQTWGIWTPQGWAANPAAPTVREPLDAVAYFTAGGLLRIGSSAPGLGFNLHVDGDIHWAPTAVPVPPQGRRVRLRVEHVGRARNGTRLRFQGWSDGVTEADRVAEVPGPGGRLDAVFSVEHHLHAAGWPLDGGTVAAVPPSEDGYFAEGAEVVLTAQPAEGWEFAGWTDDAAGSSPATVRMDGPKGVGAWFTETSLLAPGAPRKVRSGEPRPRGFRFTAGGAAELRIAYEPAPGAPDADLYVRGFREPYGPAAATAWERPYRGRRHSTTDALREGADFVSESPAGPEQITISGATDPPLDPDAVYFAVLATDTWPVEGTLRLETTGSAAAPPHGRAWPRAFTFVAEVGADPRPQAFELRNEGGSAMRFEASSASVWLAADPPQGSVPAGETARIAVRATGLPLADTHEGTLAIALSGPAGPVRPLALPVTFVAVPVPPSGR